MTDTRIEVRIANTADATRVAAMVEQYWAFEGMHGFDREVVCRQLGRVLGDHSLGSVWVASDGQKLVGYLITVYVFSLEHLGLTAEIDEFYVDQHYRSRGVGSSLLVEAERVATEAGCTNFSLQLAEGNQRAREMYLRHGYLPRRDYVLLEKNLGGS